MRYLIFILVLSVCSLSCKEKPSEIQKEESSKEPMVYEMYQPSEMALLMEHMYAYNMQLKKDIEAGKTPEQFPMDFLKIHSAQMTSASDRNSSFESFSKLFIQAEKAIFDATSEVPLEDRFNNMVNLCISCHQTSCTGPIPRIKKLLIKE